MTNWMAVALGGAVGSSLRYFVGLGIASTSTISFPLATWIVNLLGSFLLAFLTPWLSAQLELSHAVRLLLTTGLCGGFTTYSTFNLEWTTMLAEGDTGQAAIYVALTALGCAGAALLGGWLARTFWVA